MSTYWSSIPTATLKLKKTDNKMASLPGVNSSDEAGTPAQFVAAANHLFAIVGEAAILHGAKRVIEQEVEEE